MIMIRAPLEEGHLETCRKVGAILLRKGTRIERVDAVAVERMVLGGEESVSSVFVHVSAETDVPNPDPNAEDPLDHAAGDCWQEVWHVWPAPDAATGLAGIGAMRVI